MTRFDGKDAGGPGAPMRGMQGACAFSIGGSSVAGALRVSADGRGRGGMRRGMPREERRRAEMARRGEEI